VGFEYDPNIKNPYSEQWNFGAEQLLSPSTTLTVNYAGSSTHRLDVGGIYNGGLTPGPGDPQSRSLFPYIAKEWFNTAAYASPILYTFGNAGRNSIRGQSYWDLDTSLFRQFPVGEGRQFEFRAEAFNLFNNVDLGQPQNDLNAGAAFGTINSTANTARQLQLAGKFIF
jgi:hypothetical protein